MQPVRPLHRPVPGRARSLLDVPGNPSSRCRGRLLRLPALSIAPPLRGPGEFPALYLLWVACWQRYGLLPGVYLFGYPAGSHPAALSRASPALSVTRDCFGLLRQTFPRSGKDGSFPVGFRGVAGPAFSRRGENSPDRLPQLYKDFSSVRSGNVGADCLRNPASPWGG